METTNIESKNKTETVTRHSQTKNPYRDTRPTKKQLFWGLRLWTSLFISALTGSLLMVWASGYEESSDINTFKTKCIITDDEYVWVDDYYKCEDADVSSGEGNYDHNV